MARLSVSLLTLLLVLSGCNSNKNQQSEEQAVSGKITLSEGWARPGVQNQTSAAYLSIHNRTASQDTIISISSEAAGNAEIHESYKGENGMMGMRPETTQIIEPGEDLYFRPNGLHIMLMKLKRDLAIGDSLTLTLEFARTGSTTTTIPVKVQN